MKKWKGILSVIIAVLIMAPVTFVSAESCNVTFNTNGGSAVTGQTIECGDYATEPTNVTKNGFTLIGWTYEAYGDTVDFNFQYTQIYSDTEISAKWVSNDKVISSVTYTISNLSVGDALGDFELTAPSGSHYKKAKGRFISNLPSASATYDQPPSGNLDYDKDYYIEIDGIPYDDGYYVSKTATIKINGFSVVKQDPTSDFGMRFLKLHSDKKEEPVDPDPEGEEEENEPEIKYYTVDIIPGNYDIDTDSISLEENSIISQSLVENNIDYNDSKYYIEGYYSDADLTKKFVFGNKITSNTKVYLKVLVIADVKENVLAKLNAAEISITSELTEKEALEKYKTSTSIPWYNVNDYKYTNSIPDDLGEGISFEDEGFYLSDPNTAIVYVEYKYKGILYYVNRKIKVIYKNTDDRDSKLDEQSSTITRKDYSINKYVDYSEYTKNPVITKEELEKLLKDAVLSIDGISDYELVNLYHDEYPNWSLGEAYRKDALVNGEFVYAYLDSSLSRYYKISIGANVNNSHEAYLESVKDELVKFFKSKGYTDVDFDLDDTNGKLYVNLYDEENDDYDDIVIYMIKDDDNFLVAKNLFVSNIDYNNYYVRAVSLSELNEYNEFKMNEYEKNSINEMKKSLENDGYDFFDGYAIDVDIPNGESVDLTFTVGTENNNRRYLVFHKKANGTIEKFTGIVKDGAFTITITDASPFAVGLGEVVKALKNNPQTFDPIVLSIILLIVSSIGACVSIKLLKD